MLIQGLKELNSKTKEIILYSMKTVKIIAEIKSNTTLKRKQNSIPSKLNFSLIFSQP